ncbi:hypothetical protein [Nocardioides litoris]|uniref:hypothetical protein n=1 Tax=Nocardioides litoris TaxID=1926648 RepID=UPI001476FAEF|nr:hypothetical protein [Nocardioides litoris]
MSLIRNVVNRFAGGAGRRGGRPVGGRPVGGRPAAHGGGTRSQDEAIGRGVRSLLRRFR